MCNRPQAHALRTTGGGLASGTLAVLAVILPACELTGKDSGLLGDNPCVASSRSDAEGQQVIASGGAVEAEFQGGDAGYANIVSLVDPAEVRIGELHTTEPGAVVSLGSFEQGVELIFALDNQEGSVFQTGPSARNPDDLPHARVVKLDNGEYHIGFEDIDGEGDADFNDTCVVVRGAVTSLLGG